MDLVFLPLIFFPSNVGPIYIDTFILSSLDSSLGMLFAGVLVGNSLAFDGLPKIPSHNLRGYKMSQGIPLSVSHRCPEILRLLRALPSL